MNTFRKHSFAVIRFVVNACSHRRWPAGNLIQTVGLWLFAAVAALAAPKPNLLCIVTDDQAHWSIGAYGNGEARTPNMDRLAREGARFFNAFVCTPVCSPSRAAFLTGRYGTQLGITDYISEREARRGAGLPTNAVTWPQVLQRHGYVTGLAGKWHLGERPPFHPTRRGYDFFFGSLRGWFEPMNPTLEVNGANQKLEGPAADLVTDAALGFLRTNGHRPFALQVHYREPHLPYGPMPAADEALFKDLDPTIPEFPNLRTNQVKNWMRAYYAAIHAVDRNLGRLLHALDELHVATNTVVLFTSDHGYMIGHHGLHTKGNARWVVGGVNGPTRPNMFEESIRTPLIVRWPGVITAGRVFLESVSNIDTFPTVLGLLGIPAPTDWRHEGQDFSPLLRGERFTPRAEIFGQYDLHNFGLAYMRMIRTSDWKLVRHYFAEELNELYDLRTDPGETRNLYDADAHANVRTDLESRLTAWMRSIQDPIVAHLDAPKER